MSADPFLEALEAIAPNYRAAAIGIAQLAWAGRRCEGELPSPVDPVEDEIARQSGICAWCFEPLGEERAEFNGGLGHPECARFAYDALAGDDAMPWPVPDVTTHKQDPVLAFCERLGREAAMLGINMSKLGRAIERARHG